MDLSEQILSADDLPREFIETPEWQPKGWEPGPDNKPFGVFVRKPTALEMDAWDGGNIKVTDGGRKREPDMTNASARLLVKVVVDEAGKRVFKESQAEQFGRKAGDVVGRLFNAAIRLSGRRGDAEKNSEPTPDDGSS